MHQIANALHPLLLVRMVLDMNYPNQNCYKFWKLAKSLKIADIVALWCDIEPSQFNHFQKQTGYTPSCADAKRVVLEDALISGELDYIDEGTPTKNGGLWIGNPVEELIQKDCLRIEKTELKEWLIKKYESGELDEIPTFLDEEKQKAIALQNERADEPLPINDMNTRNKNTAIKIMYALLIKSGLDNTYPTSKNRGSANCEIQILLDELGLSVGYETIGKFLDEVKELANQHPYLHTSYLQKNNIPF